MIGRADGSIGAPGTESGADAIAIIGMSCRFPGAADPAQLWTLLRSGTEAVTRLDEEELRASATPRRLLDREDHVRAAACIEDPAQFDARFFGMSRREAEQMDPQMRLMLECAWECFEDAGYEPVRQPHRIGVFAGSCISTYLLHNLKPRFERSAQDMEQLLGNDKDYLATFISYKLDLRGPSVSVNTACSTSLVAVHLACQSILTGECRMALAGAASLTFPQRTGYLAEEGGIQSPDGHCRAFDAEARGTVFGDGVGVVLLKSLEEALADGDRVHAVIRGTAINNDGSSKVGFTAPSATAQAQVIREALEMAAVSARSIGMLEAHGTGTSLGDPIEVQALTDAYRSDTRDRAYCALGSVKTNLGHARSAAGMAGLLKAVLAVKHGEIPASLNYLSPNPKLQLETTPFFVNTKLRRWRDVLTPRRAGVSSFGIGGTNAHVIVEQAPTLPRAETPPCPGRRTYLVPLSARSLAALEAQARRLERFVAGHPELPLADIATTLQEGRRSFERRRLLRCRDRGQLLEALREPAAAGCLGASSDPPRRPHTTLGLVLTGGLGWSSGLVRALHRGGQLGRHLDAAVETLPEAERAAVEALVNGTGEEVGAQEERLLGLAGEWAFACRLREVVPSVDSIVGLGAGEPLAAGLNGLLAPPQALLEASRSAVEAREQPGGEVGLLVGLPHDALAAIVGPDARRGGHPRRNISWLAISAARGSALEDKLRLSGVAHQRIPAWLVRCLELDGQRLLEAEDTSPDLLVITAVVGVPPTLQPLAAPFRGPATLVALGEEALRQDGLAQLAGGLWIEGTDVDWKALRSAGGRRVSLPTYPFERELHWIEPPMPIGEAGPAAVAKDTAETEQGLSLEGERSELEGHIRTAWARVLGVPVEGPDDDFYDLGGSSIYLPEVALLLGDRLGKEVPLSELFEATTVRSLAVRLAGPRETTAAVPGVARELEKRVVLPDELRPLPRPPRAAAEARNLLLTGATGFLGAYLLRELLRLSSADIHCLVRAPDERTARERLRARCSEVGIERAGLGRIHVHRGDLEKAHLGIGPERYALLARSLDAIYHCGAHVSFAQPYDHLAAANVGSTLEILALASERCPKAVHFVSSLAVFSPDRSFPDNQVTETSTLEPAGRLTSSYAETKWAADRLMGLAADRGFPVRIYRTTILGAANAGGPARTSEFIWSLLRGCLEMQLAPAMDVELNILPVDVAARLLVRLSLLDQVPQQRVMHIANRVQTPWSLILALLQPDHPGLEIVSFDSWLEELEWHVRECASHPLAAFVPMLRRNRGGLGEEWKMRLRFDASRTLALLEPGSVPIPAIDGDYLRRFLGARA